MVETLCPTYQWLIPDPPLHQWSPLPNQRVPCPCWYQSPACAFPSQSLTSKSIPCEFQVIKVSKLSMGSDTDRSSQTYEKPSTYSQLLMELNKTCDLGNRDSQIKKPAPHMAAALKKAKEWEQLKVELEKSDEETLSIIKSEEAFAQFHSGALRTGSRASEAI